MSELKEELKKDEVAEATKILQEKRQQTIEACTQEVNIVLNKHNCIIDVSMIIGSQGVQPIVNIIPITEGQGKVN